MPKSPDEMLALYETAIESLLSGGVQSYTIGSRTFTKLDLGKLEDLRRYWEGRTAESQHGFTTGIDLRGGGGL